MRAHRSPFHSLHPPAHQQVLVFRRAMVTGSRSLDVSSSGQGSGKDLAAVDFDITTTGLRPFSISLQSPGFQLLARALMTPRADLGMVPTLLPEIENIGGYRFGGHCLLQSGTNIVFQVQILSCPSTPSPSGGSWDEDNPGPSNDPPAGPSNDPPAGAGTSTPSLPSSQQMAVLKLCGTDHEVECSDFRVYRYYQSVYRCQDGESVCGGGRMFFHCFPYGCSAFLQRSEGGRDPTTC